MLGTALPLAAVVGSGIMGERLSAGNIAIALLANAIATGAVLVAVILAFGSISGAHFNPVVTLSNAYHGEIRWKEVPAYVLAQFVGAFAGLLAAHVMFGEPLLSRSAHARAGAHKSLANSSRLLDCCLSSGVAVDHGLIQAPLQLEHTSSELICLRHRLLSLLSPILP